MYTKEIDSPNPYIEIRWHVSDIVNYAKDQDISLTLTQAIDVLELLIRTHDCNSGISWDAVDCAIEIRKKMENTK
jgi:hypothetical protein